MEIIMKILRIAVLLIFLLLAVTYLGYRGYVSRSTDTIGPEIQYQPEELQISVKASEQDLLQEVTAFDVRDKDVSESLLVESLSDFISPGKRLITYAAFDSNNNVTRQERELVYTDYTSPQFTILKPLRFALGSSEDLSDYLEVFDCLDGNITDKVKFDQPDYYYGTIIGRYPIQFRATNSAGDTAYLSAEVEFY